MSPTTWNNTEGQDGLLWRGYVSTGTAIAGLPVISLLRNGSDIYEGDSAVTGSKLSGHDKVLIGASMVYDAAFAVLGYSAARIPKYNKAPVKGLDFVEGTGRLGGELYDAGKLAKLGRYLERRGIQLKVGDEFVPVGKAGGFAHDGSSLVLKSNPTSYEVWHELAHLRQFQKIGKDAYMKLPRSTSFNAPEQHVFDLLENSKKRWNALNFEQQQHAIDYIERIGGFR